MKFEDEIENLLKSAVPDFATVASLLKESDDASAELFGIVQKELRIHGQAILRLAAAIDGLSMGQDEPS